MASGAVGAGLTAEDLAELTDALAQGRRPTVYLRDPVPGLGLPAAVSAKVVSVDGATVLVSPRGVNDELPFEADELRMTRKAVTPARKAVTPAPKAAPTPKAPRKTRPATVVQPAERTVEPAPTETPPAKPAPTPRAGGARRKAPTTVTVTLHADLDGAWTVAVQLGDRAPGKAVTVDADAVEKAIAELGEPGALRAVQAALDTARRAAAARVEELTRQLERARGTLAALGASSEGPSRQLRNKGTRRERSS
ncbi:DUF6319 family protein [Aldersonia sp. NBC_00410]|nr:DUF6319 family protein [Aldersonia sp. NBC_00410]